jgi:hypothetical protein
MFVWGDLTISDVFDSNLIGFLEHNMVERHGKAVSFILRKPKEMRGGRMTVFVLQHCALGDFFREKNETRCDPPA